MPPRRIKSTDIPGNLISSPPRTYTKSPTRGDAVGTTGAMSLISEEMPLKMGTKVIAVRVGAEPLHMDFAIHEDLVSDSSEFFKAALGSNWRETEERLVKLPSCQPKAFRIYVQWLYHGRLHISQSGGDKSVTEMHNLKDGYLLGDFLQDYNYKDTLLDALRDWVKAGNAAEHRLFVTQLAKLLFRETSDKAPVRRLLIDVAVWCLGHEFWTKDKSMLPEEFVQEAISVLSARYQSGKDVADPFKPGFRLDSVCLYHCHGEKLCYRAEKKERIMEKNTTRRRQFSGFELGLDLDALRTPAFKKRG